ncbi:MAG: YkgJ family cysteine cluster protein [Vulcanimicrobiota bacterium]
MRHDPPLTYDCIRCGHSCRSFEVQVELAEAERLGLSGSPGRPGFLVLPTTTQGCSYLTADSLCGLHCDRGPEAKPSACRSFPLVARHTPDGLFTGLSFCCTAVRTQHGRPLAQHDLAGVELEPVPEAGYDEYVELESRLRAGLDEPADLLGLAPSEMAGFVVELVLIVEAGHPDNLPALYQKVTEGLLPSRLLGRTVEVGRPWWTCTPPADGLALRYLNHVLHRKDLALLDPDLAVVSFVMRAYLLRWYAHTSGDWSRAVDIVERHAGLHARGLEPFFASVAQRLP